MSWYVEQILLSEAGFEVDIDSDSFSDLLSIEIMVSKLDKKGLISRREFVILQLIKSGFGFKQISELLEIDKRTVIQTYKGICAKLAFFLGDHFTDQGYLDYLSTKYHLDEDEIEILCKILE